MIFPSAWKLLSDASGLSLTTAAAGLLSLFLLLGCKQEQLPFTARYTSPSQVLVTYQGRQHTLNRYGPAAQAPFQYRFEPDGDLNLFIDGREYDVDSPYDIDRKKTSAKKKRTKKRRR